MAFVSITRLRVRSWRFLPWFFLYALRSASQAAKAGGNLAVRLLRDRRNTFWTATCWTTEAAMKEFMLAGIHRRAMNKLANWCDEAALVHWVQDADDPPNWKDACGRLQRGGRPSRVNHPSRIHTEHKFPEPQVGKGSAFQLK